MTFRHVVESLALLGQLVAGRSRFSPAVGTDYSEHSGPEWNIYSYSQGFPGSPLFQTHRPRKIRIQRWSRTGAHRHFSLEAFRIPHVKRLRKTFRDARMVFLFPSVAVSRAGGASGARVVVCSGNKASTPRTTQPINVDYCLSRPQAS